MLLPTAFATLQQMMNNPAFYNQMNQLCTLFSAQNLEQCNSLFNTMSAYVNPFVPQTQPISKPAVPLSTSNPVLPTPVPTVTVPVVSITVPQVPSNTTVVPTVQSVTPITPIPPVNDPILDDFFIPSPPSTRPQIPVTTSNNPFHLWGNWLSHVTNSAFPVQTVNPDKYRDQLNILAEMGWSNREQCLKALKRSKGDLDRAIEILLAQ